MDLHASTCAQPCGQVQHVSQEVTTGVCRPVQQRARCQRGVQLLPRCGAMLVLHASSRHATWFQVGDCGFTILSLTAAIICTVSKMLQLLDACLERMPTALHASCFAASLMRLTLTLKQQPQEETCNVCQRYTCRMQHLACARQGKLFSQQDPCRPPACSMPMLPRAACHALLRVAAMTQPTLAVMGAALLQWEHSWLEAQLGQEMSGSQREALFEEWGIPASGKQRKQRLVASLFAPHTLQYAALTCGARHALPCLCLARRVNSLQQSMDGQALCKLVPLATTLLWLPHCPPH